MTGFLSEKELSRRSFLKGSGALVVGVAIVGSGMAANATADGSPFPTADPSQLDSWLAIDSGGKVTIFTGRIDSGQHKDTAYAQIVGDELDVPLSSISLVMGDTARVVNQGGSTASDGLVNGVKPLRHAAAQARAVLLGLASTKLGVPVAQLSVSNGVVSGGGSSVSYGDLIGGRHFNTTVKVLSSGSTIDIQGTARVKDPSQYKLVGKSLPAMSIPDKVTGTFTYIQNVHVPGMVHARLVLPPSVGAHLVSVDGFRKKPEGLVKVVVKGDFVAVVTEQEWQAIEAMSLLKTTWKERNTLPGSGDVFEYLRTTPPFKSTLVGSNGNVDTALAAAPRQFSAQYNYPGNIHGLIGPQCAVADVQGSQCTLLTPTQVPFSTQAAVGTMLGIPTTNVHVVYVEGSGQYGRGGMDDAGVAAAFISQQIGKPVRVQLMRQQETGWGPSFPPSAFTFRAGVDSTGQIVAWDHVETAWGTNSLELPLQLAASADVTTTGGPSNRPPGGGDVATYGFANFRQVGNSVPVLLRGIYMRSPGRIQVNFAGEQFMDEIASATGQDPIQFRLRHLADNTDIYTLASIKPRMQAVLQAAQQVSGWDTRPSPGPGAKSSDRVVSGRGIAIVASQRSSYVANVAEVEVDKKTGRVYVKQMHVIVDAGQIVNPRAIEAQITGATLYATSRALKEQMVFDKSKVTSVDWVTYPIMRFLEVPEQIDVTLLDQPNLSPVGSFDNGGMGSFVNSGIGEPPNTVPPAAIGNAIFDATGVRIRQAPFTPARVRAALKSAGVTA
jgi:CO/xanthine dehydrogenase Mo-binding subunit